MNKLKRAALLLIANKMAPEEVAGLRAIFKVTLSCFGQLGPSCCARHLAHSIDVSITALAECFC